MLEHGLIKKSIFKKSLFNRPWQHVLEPLGGYLLLGYKLANDMHYMDNHLILDHI